MRIQHSITLDVSKQGVQVTIPITRGDSGTHRLMIRLRNNEETVTLGASDSAILYLSEPEVWEPMAVYTESGAYPGCLVCDLTATASTHAGIRRAVVMIADPKGNLLHSPELAIAVREDLAADSAVAESAPYAAVILAQNEAEASAVRAESAEAGARAILRQTEETVEQSKKEAADAAAEAAERVGEETRQTLRGIQSEINQELEQRVTDEEVDARVESAFDSHFSELYDLAYSAKEYTDAELAKATSVRVVSALPAEGVANKIYLLPTASGEQENLYEEYLWVNRGSEAAPDFGWEFIASRSVNLSDYVKKTDIPSPQGVGVGKSSSTYGVYCNNSTTYWMISAATKELIDEKTDKYKPIVSSVLDYAVKAGITANAIPLTAKEKAAALNWLGADTEALEKRVGRLEAAAEGRLYVTETVDTAKISTLTDADRVLPICAIERIPLYPGRETVGSYVLDVTFPESFREAMRSLIGQLNAAYEENPSDQLRCDVEPLEGRAILYVPSYTFDTFTFADEIEFVPTGNGEYVYETPVTLPGDWLDCHFGTFPDVMEYQNDSSAFFEVEPGVGATLRVVAYSEEIAQQMAQRLGGASGDIEGHCLEKRTVEIGVDFSPYPTLPDGTSDLQSATDCPDGVSLTVMRRIVA